jgi:hypothetical protein
MFTYADGRPIRPEYLTHRFRQLCKELGLPPIRLHDLRHGAATLASAVLAPRRLCQGCSRPFRHHPDHGSRSSSGPARRSPGTRAPASSWSTAQPAMSRWASPVIRSPPVQVCVGRRINSATLVADARMPALGGALAGLAAVALGFPCGATRSAVTLFICHLSHDVTADVVRRLADGVGPGIAGSAEAAAGAVDGVVHAMRWPGGRGGSCGWKSRAGAVRGSPSAALPGWAGRSPWLSRAASPGPPRGQPPASDSRASDPDSTAVITSASMKAASSASAASRCGRSEPARDRGRGRESARSGAEAMTGMLSQEAVIIVS